MSHVKAGGSSKNIHNNAGRRLGVKRFGAKKFVQAKYSFVKLVAQRLLVLVLLSAATLLSMLPLMALSSLQKFERASLQARPFHVRKLS